MKLESLPYLEASIQDFHEAMARSKEISPKNKRHSVLLLEEAFEFLFYQKLSLLGVDIYRDGQSTIGIDKAIELIKDQEINLFFLNSIRKVQKLRGDAKHHAQVPTDREYKSLLEKLNISYAAFLFENFWEDLGETLFAMNLIPYEEALYTHAEYLKAHRVRVACRQILSACIHKMRAFLDDKSVLRTWLIQGVDDLSSILESLVEHCIDLPLPPETEEAMRHAMSMIEESVGDENYIQLYERARMTYGFVDEISPSDFDLGTAIRITDKLVVPKAWSRIALGRAWTPHVYNDTKLFKDLQRAIEELLQQSSMITSQLPPALLGDTEGGPLWRLAVFDGYKWHSFFLDDDYTISPELGDLEDPVSSQRRQSVAQVIYDELLQAEQRG